MKVNERVQISLLKLSLANVAIHCNKGYKKQFMCMYVGLWEKNTYFELWLQLHMTPVDLFHIQLYVIKLKPNSDLNSILWN